MEIQALSGATVTQLHEEELSCMVESGQSGKDLKKLLASRIGYSRFRQRLFSEDMGELQDEYACQTATKFAVGSLGLLCA